MAASGVRVSCSGAVLSSLLYEQLRSGHAQEGFLLGQVQSHISEHISDSQICNEKMETLINVSSFLPCTMIGSFYSGAGILNEEKLNAYMGPKFKNVIGWYRCRGSSCEDLYLREMLVHKQLAAVMSHTGGHFIMGIMSCSPSVDSGTFTVSHKFMMLQNNRLEGVPLQVVNMGDTSTTDYLLKPQNPALYSSVAVRDVLSNIESNEPGVQEAETLHMGLLEKLSLLLPKFSSAQQELEDTLNDVVALRRLCNRNNISPDFIPKVCQTTDEENLMDFEEIPASPAPEESQVVRGKVRGTSRVSVRRKGSGRGRGAKDEKVTSSDPFGFVDKEMEKLQVKGRGTQSSRVSRSRTNTPSPGRVITKTQASSGTQGTPPRRSSVPLGTNSGSSSPAGKRSKENSPMPSGSQDSGKKDSQEGGLKGRPKSSRGLTRTSSKDSNSPSRSARGRSPTLTGSASNKSGKPKAREAWSEKTPTDSQEF
ncbi:BRISC complex subunit Abraxas 2-like isoform X1 [Penaeus japonicus]|uniref:BRISC complex subunit Abraxas 2-like isoform X1 n=1 Tax=Penaeus japonicus TaxID=27405 RepID=UPI001C715860|nr:BRISC complex subunit Abraxas 2-like isoform X1 [Penaeus japonicus]